MSRHEYTVYPITVLWEGQPCMLGGNPSALAISISGNMVADPELKSTTGGVTLCRFTVAVNRRYPSKDADFFSCVAWREQAEFIYRNFKKGQWIELSGSMLRNKYKDREGNPRSTWELNVNQVGFVGAKKAAVPILPKEYRSANFEELAGDGELPF